MFRSLVQSRETNEPHSRWTSCSQAFAPGLNRTSIRILRCRRFEVLHYTNCDRGPFLKKLQTESCLMNGNVVVESSASPGSFVAWIGMDWGDKNHALRLAVAGQKELEKECLVNSPEALHDWFKKLEARFGGRPVALALEANRGGLLHIFAQYPWLVVYPVNPATSAWYRKAFAV